jgi:hypothetical protein
VKEREVKESVRIELVKALRQARFNLTGRGIARSGFITTLEKQQTGNSRHEDLLAILPTSPTTAGRGKPLQAVTRRQFTTFYKQTVVGNHYSCLQNVVREQFLGQRGGRRRQGNNRYRGGEHRRYRRGAGGGRKFDSRNTGTRTGAEIMLSSTVKLCTVQDEQKARTLAEWFGGLLGLYNTVKVRQIEHK